MKKTYRVVKIEKDCAGDKRTIVMENTTRVNAKLYINNLDSAAWKWNTYKIEKEI